MISARPARDLTARLAPVATTIACALVSVVPLEIPGYAMIAPQFMLIAVYHWTFYRPDDLPYLAVFLIGLGFDLLTAGPLGLSPLLLLGIRWAVFTGRRYFLGRGFAFVWAGFALAAAAVGGLSWAVGSLYDRALLDPTGYLFEAVLSVAFFPIMTSLFARLQRVGSRQA